MEAQKFDREPVFLNVPIFRIYTGAARKNGNPHQYVQVDIHDLKVKKRCLPKQSIAKRFPSVPEE